MHALDPDDGRDGPDAARLVNQEEQYKEAPYCRQKCQGREEDCESMVCGLVGVRVGGERLPDAHSKPETSPEREGRCQGDLKVAPALREDKADEGIPEARQVCEEAVQPQVGLPRLEDRKPKRARIDKQDLRRDGEFEELELSVWL